MPVSRSTAESMRLAGQGLVLAGIGVGRSGDQDPAPQRFEVVLVDQPRCARHPPGRGGMVAEVGVVDHRELYGDGGSLGRIGLPSELRVGSLPAFERLPDLPQPPHRLCQARQDLGDFLRLELYPGRTLPRATVACVHRALERSARLSPSSSCQGFLPNLDGRGWRLGRLVLLLEFGLCRYLLGVREKLIRNPRSS
jgi:hypothetical protein